MGSNVNLLEVIFTPVIDFICLGFAVYILLKLAMRRVPNATHQGIWLCAVFLITSAIFDLLNFTDMSYYRQIFAQLSDEVFKLRMGFSAFLRVFSLVIGFGLILRKNWARQLAIYLCLFTIATIIWKHPYYVFENIAIIAEQQFFQEPVTELQYPSFPWISMFTYITLDIVISICIIFYLKQDKIVEEFKHEIKNQSASREA